MMIMPTPTSPQKSEADVLFGWIKTGAFFLSIAACIVLVILLLIKIRAFNKLKAGHVKCKGFEKSAKQYKSEVAKHKDEVQKLRQENNVLKVQVNSGKTERAEIKSRDNNTKIINKNIKRTNKEIEELEKEIRNLEVNMETRRARIAGQNGCTKDGIDELDRKIKKKENKIDKITKGSLLKSKEELQNEKIKEKDALIAEKNRLVEKNNNYQKEIDGYKQQIEEKKKDLEKERNTLNVLNASVANGGRKVTFASSESCSINGSSKDLSQYNDFDDSRIVYKNANLTTNFNRSDTVVSDEENPDNCITFNNINQQMHKSYEDRNCVSRLIHGCSKYGCKGFIQYKFGGL